MNDIGTDTVIIGASVAGLFLATKIQKCIVLERRHKVGGKVRTTNDKNSPQFDDGPWRFHDTHENMKNLLEEYKIGFKENTSHAKKIEEKFDSKCKAGLSTFGSNAFHHNIQTARDNSIKSGYDGMAYADCGGNVYHGQRHQEGKYYYVENGMREIVTKLFEKVEEKVKTESMVVDIKKHENGFTITYIHDKQTKSLICTKVILCTPAEKLEFPSIDKYLRPIRSSVECVPLMHVYAKLNKGKLPPMYKIDPSSHNTQIISGDLSDYFQLSYTGGRTAMYLRDLYLNYPKDFKTKLIDDFKRLLPEYDVDADSIQVRYWDEAVHFWRPILNISGKSISNLSSQSIEPHPLILKNLYLCGESFSTKQGWIEGALETAKEVLKRIETPKEVSVSAPDTNSLSIDGRVIDVSQFKEIHPGSTEAIQNFVGKDASFKFQSIGHPPYAYSYLFQLQKGYTK